MRVGVIGFNQKQASLALREKITKIIEESKTQMDNSISSVVLSTCNRIEIYFSSFDLAKAQEDLVTILEKRVDGPIKTACYQYIADRCFTHLCKVISGLDSTIYLESEIQGQVKKAYETTRKKTSLPFDLHYFFQKGLKVGKEIRKNIGNGKGGSNLPKYILSYIQENTEQKEKSKILFVGNSSINQRIMSLFFLETSFEMTLATSMPYKDSKTTSVVSRHELENVYDYDVVIFGTKHHEFILNHIPPQKKSLLIFDLAVPRNVNPDIGDCSNIKLVNMENIESYIASRKKDDQIKNEQSNTLLELITKYQMQVYEKKVMRGVSYKANGALVH